MQQDLFLGKQLRDEGTQLALDHAGDNWHDAARHIALSKLKMAGPKGCLFEEIRHYATELGLPEPPSPNAWGAIALHLSKSKKIVKTGEYRNARSVRSHAHTFAVWRLGDQDGN
jgi:hypothetical protein